ncbi:ROK family transcriptional regulator [Streptomyces sp. 378]|uniref:ROK family transcriptional regulator n=1 Tax=Streptomyces sp. 378 TaxID=3049412 RepID=UPI0024C36C50|nr:ROK family transcriptional regulator [Streptomyces sp. 378]MDK1346557.1 ROK family transcriptional regulator [Streptomyces sp. 378]
MPASPSTARAINDRLALRLLQQEGPLTAGRLKQLTGLSRPTVADLVERLTAAGLIAVVGETGEQRRGPNAKVYGIVADRAHLAALDVRTEGVSVAVADLVGGVLAEASVPIGGDMGTGPAVEQAVTLVERVVKDAGADRLHTVGIGAPGLIDPSSGELRDSTGLPEWHRRFVATLQERLPHTRVRVENETNLAAVAEQRDGAARDRDTFVLLWLGHGTGAAVVLDGALRRGASGGTGEIGFLPVPGTAALPTSTDCEGGFHSLASSAAVLDLAAEYGVAAAAGQEVPAVGVVRAAAGVVREAVGRVRSAALPRQTGPLPEVPPSGSDPAARFLDALADRLAVGVASVVAILDPGCVVLGGEVGKAGGVELAARVQDRIARMTPLPTEVRVTTLGGGAVLRGALLSARDRAQEELFTPGEGLRLGRPDGGQGPSSPPPGRSVGVGRP